MKALFASLFLCGLLTVGCQSSEPAKTEGEVSIKTPEGQAAAGGSTSVTEEQLTIPFYPGSIEKAGESMKVEMDTEKSYMTVRTSPDEPQKIADFYTEKEPLLKFTKMEADGTVTMMAMAERPDGGKLSVVLTKKSGEAETKISMGYGIEAKK